MSFNNSESISNSIFELIHSDVWGPSLVLVDLDILLFLLMIILVIVGFFL